MKCDNCKLIDLKHIQTPSADLASCSCGWSGEVKDMIQKLEGDYESGYYYDYLCPVCKDGEIEYNWTEKQWIRWLTWNKKMNDIEDCIDKENNNEC